jgi:hypothetical protein|tara:strand:+ start:4242 stop:5147 length:906 start_codon:yes stop_codon:yes gene_type:complete
MFGLDNSNQYIDWWHEALPDTGEGFDHEGTLTSVILSPTITIGLSNYWNFTLGQSIGNRTMTWDGDATTIHHRDEGTDEDYFNAIGGYLGDTKLMLRYLVFNDGQGPGKRLFLGGGFILPSKNSLSSDPFFLSGSEKTDHRHFALSEGIYKGCFEIQLFKKKMTNPVFMGGTIYVEKALAENDYGFKASDIYDLSLTAFSKKIPTIGGSLGANIITRHTTKAYWNQFEAPNSRATVVTVGVGGLWDLAAGGVSLNIQKPFFIKGAFSGIEGEQGQRVDVWQVSLSYRRLLDFVIPWLDPLK